MAQNRQERGRKKAQRFTHSTKTHEKSFITFLFQIERKTSKVMISVGIAS
tara:strand:+ start:134 stop:283 length:150 start_codon:yes stop_codon:yes gene_type:complete